MWPFGGLLMPPADLDAATTQGTFFNNTININTAACNLWTSTWQVGSGLGVYNNVYQLAWQGNTINCKDAAGITQKVLTTDLACDASRSPVCSASGSPPP